MESIAVRVRCCAVAWAFLASGCVVLPPAPSPDALLTPDSGPVAATEAPLGGASLAQRKSELVRARDDLLRFQETMETLRQRRDRNGKQQFKGFLEDYLSGHLEPLLEAPWLSEHPELIGLDANVRLVQAELFMLMGDDERMERVVEEIERRFAGREEMLVDYPVGRQSTLREALDHLGRRKWFGKRPPPGGRAQRAEGERSPHQDVFASASAGIGGSNL